MAGAIEATITHKAEVRKVRIAIDKEAPQDFIGSVWSRTNVAPGIHVLSVQNTSEPPASIVKVVEVGTGSVARIEIELPE